MLGSHQDTVRVGTWIAIVIAVVAFLVLLLTGNAHPAEPAAVRTPASFEHANEVERILLQRAAVSSAERVSEARALLDRERRSRLATLARAVTEAGLRVVSGSSPRSLYSSARGIWKQARSWMKISPAERRALELLEPEIEAGTADASMRALYEALRERERAALAKRKLGAAKRALARDKLGRARRRLAAARRHDPSSPRLEALTRKLAEREELRRIPAPERRFVVQSELSREELRLALELLLGHYEALAGSDAETDEQRLMRAVASYLDGEIDRAVAELRELGSRESEVGSQARAWLADPSIVDAELELRRASRRHRLERALTWVGGNRLRSRGADASLAGLRAWREALTPLNLALALPARALRGDDAPTEGVRDAAALYLELQPDGPLANESRAWIGRAALSGEEQRRTAGWDDGRLVLPPARTAYPRILGRPILVTTELVGRAGIPALAARAGAADALLLATSRHALAGESETLDRDAALALIAELARGIDAGEIRPFGRNRGSALETVRRLDGAIRSGQVQARVLAWSERPDRARPALRQLFADGDAYRVAEVDIERGSKELRASRAILGGEVSCPAQLVCVGRARAWSGQAFAEVGSDGSVRLRTRASFHGMAVSLQINELVPSASVSIPIARWLRIDRWLPLGARLGIGLGGVSFGPTVRNFEGLGQAEDGIASSEL
jgi:hypothetical protein